jgi:hypothetical protein
LHDPFPETVLVQADSMQTLRAELIIAYICHLQKHIIVNHLLMKFRLKYFIPALIVIAYFSAGTGGTAYGISSTCVMVQGDFTGALFFVID